MCACGDDEEFPTAHSTPLPTPEPPGHQYTSYLYKIGERMEPHRLSCSELRIRHGVQAVHTERRRRRLVMATASHPRQELRQVHAVKLCAGASDEAHVPVVALTCAKEGALVG
jgi:hypothetical protein